ncbi:unnamed protein product [Somion occarium]|uniref:Uncharacterized protein n=1 Tax=Somion occarium TaxID=3059160 RepID=A0ABP1DCS4_9APHY
MSMSVSKLAAVSAGVSLMALGAMANHPELKVKIVPVGLSYFHASRFRSRAVVEFGSAMDVPQQLVEMFKEGGNNKRTAVAKLLDLVYDGLKTVTLRAPDYDTLMLIQAARRLYRTPGQHLTLGQVVELNKRFLEGYLHFKDEPKVIKLRQDVLKYNRLLRDLGLRDHQVPLAKKSYWKTLGLFFYRFLLLVIWSSLALPGVILNGPIFIAASLISRKKAKEALAASVVKVAGKDVLATWKILISLGAAPVLYGFYAFLATVLAFKVGASLTWKILTPIAVMVALPFIGYAALKFGEAGMDVLKSLRPLFVALVPGQQRYLKRLKEMRLRLSNELVDVINEFGPKIYENFNEFRILVPSASVPPSSGQPGLWRRKTSTGAVDAQGNLLSHPMTWLDERLFGWSRSARRGTSAWAGSASNDISRAATPEGSSDEEGDYDTLNYLEVPSRSKSRSRQGSYADLTRIRKSSNASTTSLPVPARGEELRMTSASASDTNILHMRYGPRTRRASLSDIVSVERIGALDRAESFPDATDEINQEVDKQKGERLHQD